MAGKIVARKVANVGGMVKMEWAAIGGLYACNGNKM